MYCSACGQLNAPNATICSKCGRAMHTVVAGAPVPVPAPVMSDRVERHIQTVSILWLIYGFMGVLGWFVAIPFLTGIFGMGHGFPFHHRGFPFTGFPFPALIPFITVMVLLRSGLEILTGIALIMRVRWGRILAIVVAILSLMKIPFGTALGIYTLWVLLPGESGYAYDRLVTR